MANLFFFRLLRGVRYPLPVRKADQVNQFPPILDTVLHTILSRASSSASFREDPDKTTACWKAARCQPQHSTVLRRANNSPRRNTSVTKLKMANRDIKTIKTLEKIIIKKNLMVAGPVHSFASHCIQS